MRNPPLILTQGIKERTGEVVVSGTGPGEATGYGAESVREGSEINIRKLLEVRSGDQEVGPARENLTTYIRQIWLKSALLNR